MSTTHCINDNKPVTIAFENEFVTIAKTIQNNIISNGFLLLITNSRGTQQNQNYNIDIITQDALKHEYSKQTESNRVHCERSTRY